MRLLWAHRRRMAHVVLIFSPCVRPKRVPKQEMHRLPRTWLAQDGHEDARGPGRGPGHSARGERERGGGRGSPLGGSNSRQGGSGSGRSSGRERKLAEQSDAPPSLHAISPISRHQRQPRSQRSSGHQGKVSRATYECAAPSCIADLTNVEPNAPATTSACESNARSSSCRWRRSSSSRLRAPGLVDQHSLSRRAVCRRLYCV